MPQLVRITLGALISLVPYVTLAFIPFWGQLRISKRKFWTVITLFLLFYLYAEVTIPSADIFKTNYKLIQLYIAVLMSVCFGFYFAIVKAQFSKLLYVFLVVATYNLYITSLIHFGLATFYLQDYDIYYPASATFIHAVLLAISMPYVIYFFTRHVKRSMRGKDNPAWKNMWIIPGILLTVVFIFSDAYFMPLIESWEYASIMLLLGVGSFLIYYVVLKMIAQTEKNDRLSHNISLNEKQIALQSKQYENLQSQIAETKALRHDLRHHLAVLKSYGNAGDLQGLNTHIDELIGTAQDDDDDVLLCSNYAVNAVARHYLSIAKSEGVEVDILLDIPEKVGTVPDMDLCIIVGNFLENALEACRRMGDGKRFIRVRSKIENAYLSITVDNSFNGVWKERGGVYLSTKHEGAGIGLSSVQAVTERHNGLTEFRVSGNTFLSAALIAITQGAIGRTGMNP